VGSSRALTLGGSLAEHNEYGTLWVSGQLVHWLFEQTDADCMLIASLIR